MKKRWLIPLVLVLVLAIGTLGASAYFNSQRPTTGYISSGTLNLVLSNNGGVDYATNVALPWDFSNMAPGDEVSGDLYMKNDGSIAARMVTFEWTNISNTAFADHIFLTHVWDSKNTVDAIAGVASVADTNHDTKVSLNELAALSGIFHYPFDAVSDVDPFLPPNSPQYLHMEFQFDPQAGNDLQGASLSYGLIITAEQVPVFP